VKKNYSIHFEKEKKLYKNMQVFSLLMASFDAKEQIR